MAKFISLVCTQMTFYRGPRTQSILGGNLGNRDEPQCVVFWTYVDSKSS